MKYALFEELTANNVYPEVNRGKVSLWRYDEAEVKAAGGNYANLKPKPYFCEGEGYLDAHTEGADRGGYVPYWERGDEKVFFSGDNEWGCP